MVCKWCKEDKDEESFYKAKGRKNGKYFGRQSHCKVCHNAYMTKRNRKYHLLEYGITEADYEALLTIQDHRCAICGLHEDKFSKRLAVDHNHETGKVRGLLCTNCNVGLGCFFDNSQLTIAATSYLKEREN